MLRYLQRLAIVQPAGVHKYLRLSGASLVSAGCGSSMNCAVKGWGRSLE